MTQTLASISKSTSKKKNNLFHIGSIIPLTEKNHSDLFFKVAEATCELGFQISVLAEGDAEAQEKCLELYESYPQQFEILESVPKNHPKILNKVDVLVFPVTPSKEILELVIKKGIVPILPQTLGFEDFNPQEESGNSFVFEENNFWQFFACIIRASENHKFSYDWRNLQKSLKNTELR